MVRVLVCSYRLPGDVFRLGARVVFCKYFYSLLFMMLSKVNYIVPSKLFWFRDQFSIRPYRFNGNLDWKEIKDDRTIFLRIFLTWWFVVFACSFTSMG